MPAPRVASLEFLDALDGSGQARLRVGLEDKKQSSFLAAAFDRPEEWTRKPGFWFGEPVLYLRRLEPALARAAVDAMAGGLGGYWLRYYRASTVPGKKGALGTASLERVQDGAGVVEAVLKDGREFSILAATPERWRRELDARKLDFYFGPLVLFLKKPDNALARRAAKLMAETDEQLFPRYDTPRKTLAGVLDEFASSRR
jgi:hypothetical protein